MNGKTIGPAGAGDRPRGRLFGAFVVCAALACAPLPAVAQGAIEDRDIDPLESFNRAVFEFNMFFDRNLFQPVAHAYVDIFPAPIRTNVSNLVRHVSSPVVFANDILQGEFTRAAATLARFVVNTVAGAGMWDAAAGAGTPYHNEDFGQTLGVYGVGSGPYLMLPFFGPSTVRDAVGMVADGFMDPLGHALSIEGSIGRAGVTTVDRRATFLDESAALEKTSLDYYASIRSIYLQNREYEIRNGAPAPIQDIYSPATSPQ